MLHTILRAAQRVGRVLLAPDLAPERLCDQRELRERSLQVLGDLGGDDCGRRQVLRVFE